MWIIFFVVCSITFLVLMIEMIENYYNYHVVTTIRSYPSIPAEFPAITFCDLFNYLNQSLESKLNPDLMKYSYFSNLNTNNIYLNKIQYINDSMISCIFDNKICNADDFEIYADPVNGICLTYRPRYKISSYGLNTGLLIEFYVKNSERFDDKTYGLRLVIHDKESHAESMSTQCWKK